MGVASWHNRQNIKNYEKFISWSRALSYWIRKWFSNVVVLSVTGKWATVHNAELNDLCSTPNTLQVIKWRKMGWAGHVAHEGRTVNTGFWWRKVRKNNSLGGPRPRWENNIKMELQEVRCGGYGLVWSGTGPGQVAGNRNRGNEILGSIKCGQFLDWLTND
jgi:hypothetical protein